MSTKVASQSSKKQLSPTMSQLSVELSAPNGRTWTQPTGLFINNEFVESIKGEKLVTIDPAYVYGVVRD